MSNIDKDEIRRGISGYAHEQAVFLRLLNKRGSFTEAEFDCWYIGREYRRFNQCWRPLDPNTLILGLGINGFNRWAEMLELLQIMIYLGEVDAKKVKGQIIYSLENPAPKKICKNRDFPLDRAKNKR